MGTLGIEIDFSARYYTRFLREKKRTYQRYARKPNVSKSTLSRTIPTELSNVLNLRELMRETSSFEIAPMIYTERWPNIVPAT